MLEHGDGDVCVPHDADDDKDEGDGDWEDFGDTFRRKRQLVFDDEWSDGPDQSRCSVGKFLFQKKKRKQKNRTLYLIFV